MDEETAKKIEQRTREILEADIEEHYRRGMRKLAERVAYHEVMAESERRRRERSGE